MRWLRAAGLLAEFLCRGKKKKKTAIFLLLGKDALKVGCTRAAQVRIQPLFTNLDTLLTTLLQEGAICLTRSILEKMQRLQGQSERAFTKNLELVMGEH